MVPGWEINRTFRRNTSRWGLTGPSSEVLIVALGASLASSGMEVAMRWIMLVTVFLTALAAPAFAQKATIEAANAKWIEVFDKGDFDGLAQLYTADATLLPPGAAMVKGRAAIAKIFKDTAQQFGTPKLTTLEVKRLGPNAIREIGTYSLMTKEPSPKEVTGKYLVVWERIGGDWKLAADIWNDGK